MACVPLAAGRSSGMGLVPPRSASVSSSSRQYGGAKKSRLSCDRCRSGARRNTASPSAQLVTPSVLPVATNSERPSLLIPPGAQMPPTRGRGGGIWAPGGISSDGKSLFVASGNTLGVTSWADGEAVFRLAPDLQRSQDKRDFFAPPYWRELDETDADLGGTNPIPLDLPAASGTQAIVLVLGKDRHAYLLDRNDLGGIGGSLVAEIVAKNAIRTAPAAYPAVDGVFVAFQGAGAHCPKPGTENGLTVLNIRAGAPPSIATAWCGALRGAGAPIVTTTDGRSDSIVWIVGAEGDNRLHGFAGDTGEPLFTGGGSQEAMAGVRRFQTLIAAEDRLYVAADGRVYAFGF